MWSMRRISLTMDLNRLHQIQSSIFLICAILQVQVSDVHSQGAGGLAIGLGMDFMVDTPLGELPNPLLTLGADGPQQSPGMQPDQPLTSGTQTGGGFQSTGSTDMLSLEINTNSAPHHTDVSQTAGGDLINSNTLHLQRNNDSSLLTNSMIHSTMDAQVHDNLANKNIRYVIRNEDFTALGNIGHLVSVPAEERQFVNTGASKDLHSEKSFGDSSQSGGNNTDTQMPGNTHRDNLVNTRAYDVSLIGADGVARVTRFNPNSDYAAETNNFQSASFGPSVNISAMLAHQSDNKTKVKSNNVFAENRAFQSSKKPILESVETSSLIMNYSPKTPNQLLNKNFETLQNSKVHETYHVLANRMDVMGVIERNTNISAGNIAVKSNHTSVQPIEKIMNDKAIALNFGRNDTSLYEDDTNGRNGSKILSRTPTRNVLLLNAEIQENESKPSLIQKSDTDLVGERNASGGGTASRYADSFISDDTAINVFNQDVNLSDKFSKTLNNSMPNIKQNNRTVFPLLKDLKLSISEYEANFNDADTKVNGGVINETGAIMNGSKIPSSNLNSSVSEKSLPVDRSDINSSVIDSKNDLVLNDGSFKQGRTEYDLKIRKKADRPDMNLIIGKNEVDSSSSVFKNIQVGKINYIMNKTDVYDIEETYNSTEIGNPTLNVNEINVANTNAMTKDEQRESRVPIIDKYAPKVTDLNKFHSDIQVDTSLVKSNITDLSSKTTVPNNANAVIIHAHISGLKPIGASYLNFTSTPFEILSTSNNTDKRSVRENADGSRHINDFTDEGIYPFEGSMTARDATIVLGIPITLKRSNIMETLDGSEILYIPETSMTNLFDSLSSGDNVTANDSAENITNVSFVNVDLNRNNWLTKNETTITLTGSEARTVFNNAQTSNTNAINEETSRELFKQDANDMEALLVTGGPETNTTKVFKNNISIQENRGEKVSEIRNLTLKLNENIFIYNESMTWHNDVITTDISKINLTPLSIPNSVNLLSSGMWGEHVIEVNAADNNESTVYNESKTWHNDVTTTDVSENNVTTISTPNSVNLLSSGMWGEHVIEVNAADNNESTVYNESMTWHNDVTTTDVSVNNVTPISTPNSVNLLSSGMWGEHVIEVNAADNNESTVYNESMTWHNDVTTTDVSVNNVTPISTPNSFNLLSSGMWGEHVIEVNAADNNESTVYNESMTWHNDVTTTDVSVNNVTPISTPNSVNLLFSGISREHVLEVNATGDTVYTFHSSNVSVDAFNNTKDERKMLLTAMDTLFAGIKTRVNIDQTIFNQVTFDNFNTGSSNTGPTSVHAEVVGAILTNTANINTTNDVKIIDTFADNFGSAMPSTNGGPITNMIGGGPLNPGERLPQNTGKLLTVNMATQNKINQLEASTPMFPNNDIPRGLFVIAAGQPNAKVIAASNTESSLTNLPPMGVNGIAIGSTENAVNYAIPEVLLPHNVLTDIQPANETVTTSNSRTQEAVHKSSITLPTTQDKSRTVQEQGRDMPVVDKYRQRTNLESQSTMVRFLARNIGIDALVNDMLPQSQSTNNHYSKTGTSAAIDAPYSSPQEIKPLNSKSSGLLDRRKLKKHIDSLISNVPNVGLPGSATSVSDKSMIVQQGTEGVSGETSSKLNSNKGSVDQEAHFSQFFKPVVESNFGVKNTFPSNVQEPGIIQQPAVDFMTTFLNNAKQPKNNQIRNYVHIAPAMHGSSNVGTSSDIRNDAMQEPNLNVDQFGMVDVHTRKQLNATQWKTFMSSLSSNQKPANVDPFTKTLVATNAIMPFNGNGKTLLTLSEMNMQINGDITQPVRANTNNFFEKAANMSIDDKDFAVSTFEAPGMTGHKSVAITTVKLRPSVNIPNNSQPAKNPNIGKPLDTIEQQQVREFPASKGDGEQVSSTFRHLGEQRLPNQHAMKAFSTNWESHLPLSNKVGSIKKSPGQNARDAVDNMQNELKTFNLGRSILISDGVVPSFAKPNVKQADQAPESRKSVSTNGINLSQTFLSPDSQIIGELTKVDKVVNISKANLDISTNEVERKKALAFNKVSTDQIGSLTSDIAESAILNSKSIGSQPKVMDVDRSYSHKTFSSNNNPSAPAVNKVQKISQPTVLNSNSQTRNLTLLRPRASSKLDNTALPLLSVPSYLSNNQRSAINGQSEINSHSSINLSNGHSPISTLRIGKSSSLHDQAPTSIPFHSSSRSHLQGLHGSEIQTSNQQSMEATKFTSSSRFAVFGPANDINGRSFASSRSLPQSSELRVGVVMSPLECRYQKDPMSEFYFLHHNGGDIHRFRCALGTKFDPLTCECSIRTSAVGDCLEVHMDFNNGVVEDSSLHRLPIGNENVEITNKSSPLSGIALFGGDAKLTIWRYQNYDFRDHVMLKVQFQPAPGGDRYQPLISNCDADMDGPSVGIVYESVLKEVLLILKTINETVKELKFTVNPNEWNDVTYIYDGQEFIGIVNGVRRYISRQDPHLLGIIGGEIKSVPVQGLIEIRDAAIVLGSCPGSGHFRGAMVDIQIYTCIPKEFRLE